MTKTIIVSGGFDPIHIGHLRMFQKAKALGTKLIVILNNENFLINKKGFVFMPDLERKEIIEGFDCVDEVFISIDKDPTVCESISHLASREKISIFANGGDRTDPSTIPEYEICLKNDIEVVFNVGGGKIQSSSWLTSKEVTKPWGSYKTYEKLDDYLVKRISVKPGESLSLQSHEHRSEFWVVSKGIAKVTIEDKTYLLKEKDSIQIPILSKHRLENDTQNLLEIIEIQFGKILSEDDIKRYEDKYQRT